MEHPGLGLKDGLRKTGGREEGGVGGVDRRMWEVETCDIMRIKTGEDSLKLF